MSNDYERGFTEAIEKAVEEGKLLLGDRLEHSDAWNAGRFIALAELITALRALSPSHDTVRVPREATMMMSIKGHDEMERLLNITTSKPVIPAIWRAMVAEVK